MQPQIRSRTNRVLNAVEFLQDDSAQTQRFFPMIRTMRAPEQQQDRRELICHLCRDVVVHMRIEEMIFYPALRASVDHDTLLNRALAEHAVIQTLVEQLQQCDQSPERLEAALHVLGQHLSEHVSEKEKGLFPAAVNAALDLAALGGLLLEASRQLRTEHIALSPADSTD